MYTMYANRIVGRWLLLALLLLVPYLGQAQTDSVELKGQALKEVVISAKSKERKLHESGLPVSIISVRQLQGTASSIDDVLARTAGITIRQTGGVGSSSRLSVRGLEGKRVGVYIDEQPIGELSDMVSLNDVPIDRGLQGDRPQQARGKQHGWCGEYCAEGVPALLPRWLV